MGIPQVHVKGYGADEPVLLIYTSVHEGFNHVKKKKSFHHVPFSCALPVFSTVRVSVSRRTSHAVLAVMVGGVGGGRLDSAADELFPGGKNRCRDWCQPGSAPDLKQNISMFSRWPSRHHVITAPAFTCRFHYVSHIDTCYCVAITGWLTSKHLISWSDCGAVHPPMPLPPPSPSPSPQASQPTSRSH